MPEGSIINGSPINCDSFINVFYLHANGMNVIKTLYSFSFEVRPSVYIGWVSHTLGCSFLSDRSLKTAFRGEN